MDTALEILGAIKLSQLKSSEETRVNALIAKCRRQGKSVASEAIAFFANAAREQVCT